MADRKYVRLLCGIVLATSVLGSGDAGAQSTDESRLANLEQEMAILRNRIGRQDFDRNATRFRSGSDSHWSTGAGIYVLKPYWETNPAWQQARFGPFFGLAVDTKVENFDHDAQVAPLVWVAYTGDSGFGVRGRFWTLDSSDSMKTVNPGPDPDVIINSAGPMGLNIFSDLEGDVMKFQSILGITVVDMEATYQAKTLNWSVLGSLGARYAQLQQKYKAQRFGIDDTFELLDSNQEFEGFGPTASLEVHRQLSDSGFSLFASLRGSVLFGESTQTAKQWFDDIPVAQARNTGLDVTPVGESEIGARWSYDQGILRFFVDAAVVGQVWWGAGNSAGSQYLGALPPLPLNYPDNNSMLGLFGGRCSAGIAF